MLESQKKGLVLLVVLWADLGRCSVGNGDIIGYKWNDPKLERQGIFTGNVNNHSILAFIIKDHYLTFCETVNGTPICTRKLVHLRTEVPLHESSLPIFKNCAIPPRMTFDQLPLETQDELNATDYMIVWSFKIPRWRCLAVTMHINSSDASLSSGEGNRLYFQDHKGIHHVLKGGTLRHEVYNWSMHPGQLKVVYVQKMDAEMIDFHFTAEQAPPRHCRCTRYRRHAIFQGV